MSLGHGCCQVDQRDHRLGVLLTEPFNPGCHLLESSAWPVAQPLGSSAMATPEDIEALLGQPENINLEFKTAGVSALRLAEIIASFANTQGGTVLVGVSEADNSTAIVTGVEQRRFEGLVLSASRRLSPVCGINAFIVSVHGKQIGVIQVPRSPTPIALPDGRYFVRINALTIPGFPLNTSADASTRMRWNRRRRIMVFGITAIVLPWVFFPLRLAQGQKPLALIPDFVVISIALFVAVLVGESATRVSQDTDVARSRERVREAEVDLEEEIRLARRGDSAGAESDQSALALSDLWAVTHRRLDHYHGIALEQAAKSFRNAQAAMVLGFVLLIAFAAVGIFAKTSAGSVIAGALGAVSAGLAGYVSNTFVKSQETAAGHLRAYFDQPLEFSRYLAAERLIAEARLPEDKRAEILSILVQAMLDES